MSLLDRRKFLTGGLFATASAFAIKAADIMAPAPERNERQIGLENYLVEKHPEISRDILEQVASRYADFERSSWRPVLAAAGAGAAYAYLEDGREHGPSDKAIAVLGMDGLVSALFGVSVSPVPGSMRIKDGVADLTQSLSDDQRQSLANTVHNYIDGQMIGVPVAPAVFVTVMAKDIVEQQLDKHDVNLPSRG